MHRCGVPAGWRHAFRERTHVEAAQLIGELQRTLQEHERAGIYNQVRTEAVSKSLRDDYTFMSHCSVSWLMLMTTARSLRDHDTEELAERGYRDCARLVMRINRVMPSLVFEELQQDGFAAQDVADWSQRIVSDAWTREQVGTPSG